LLIAYRNGSPVRLSDVGEVVDSVENLRNAGIANGKPAVLVILNRQPGANIIDTVDRVKALLPSLQASIPRRSIFRSRSTAPSRSAPRCTMSRSRWSSRSSWW